MNPKQFRVIPKSASVYCTSAVSRRSNLRSVDVATFTKRIAFVRSGGSPLHAARFVRCWLGCLGLSPIRGALTESYAGHKERERARAETHRWEEMIRRSFHHSSCSSIRLQYAASKDQSLARFSSSILTVSPACFVRSIRNSCHLVSPIDLFRTSPPSTRTTSIQSPFG